MKKKVKIGYIFAITALLGLSIFLISAQSTTPGHTVGDEVIYQVDITTSDGSSPNQTMFMKIEINDFDYTNGIGTVIFDNYMSEILHDWGTIPTETGVGMPILNSVFFGGQNFFDEEFYVSFFAEPGFKVGTFINEISQGLSTVTTSPKTVISINETNGVRVSDDEWTLVHINEEIFNENGNLVNFKFFEINTITNRIDCIEYSLISYTSASTTLTLTTTTTSTETTTTATTTSPDPTDTDTATSTPSTTTPTESSNTTTSESTPLKEDKFAISGYPYVMVIGCGAICLLAARKRKIGFNIKS